VPVVPRSMADGDPETVTLTIAGDDDEDTLTLPLELVQALGEEGQSAPEVVGDLAMLSVANRAHHMVHHHEGEADPKVAALEGSAMDLFEERFGVTFGEATGHSH